MADVDRKNISYETIQLRGSPNCWPRRYRRGANDRRRARPKNRPRSTCSGRTKVTCPGSTTDQTIRPCGAGRRKTMTSESSVTTDPPPRGNMTPVGDGEHTQSVAALRSSRKDGVTVPPRQHQPAAIATTAETSSLATTRMFQRVGRPPDPSRPSRGPNGSDAVSLPFRAGPPDQTSF